MRDCQFGVSPVNYSDSLCQERKKRKLCSPDFKVLQLGSPADSLSLEEKYNIEKSKELVESLEKIVFPMRFTDKLNSISCLQVEWTTRSAIYCV